MNIRRYKARTYMSHYDYQKWGPYTQYFTDYSNKRRKK